MRELKGKETRNKRATPRGTAATTVVATVAIVAVAVIQVAAAARATRHSSVYLEEALADRECQSIHFFLGNRWMPQLAKDDLVDASFIDTLYPGMRHVALLEGDEEEALRVSAPVLLEQGSAAAVLGRGGGGNGVGGAAAWRRCRLLGVVSAAAAVLGALWGVGTE